jgi:hypothetical protein
MYCMDSKEFRSEIPSAEVIPACPPVVTYQVTILNVETSTGNKNIIFET